MSETTRRCVCPGSFDPITLGHLDIIRRASALYDEVVVAVLFNPAKSGQGMFSVDERVALIEGAVAAEEIPRVRVVSSGGELLVDLCTREDVCAIVKGLRSGTDFAYELPMALMNRHLTGVETVFLPGAPAFEHVSSSLIKEVHALGGYGLDLAPPNVAEALQARRDA